MHHGSGVECTCTMGVGWSVHAPWEWGGVYMHHGSGVECTCTMGVGWSVHVKARTMVECTCEG